MSNRCIRLRFRLGSGSSRRDEVEGAPPLELGRGGLMQSRAGTFEMQPVRRRKTASPFAVLYFVEK